MGRNAKPIDLMLVEGKKHLTKAEIQRRRDSEIKLSHQEIKTEPQVRADRRAMKEFRRLKKLYEDIEFVGELDNHLINQYCLAVSELDYLLSLMDEYREKSRNLDTDNKERVVDRYLELDVEVRMKRAELLKIGDRLYLNPVSRTKNLPKPKKEEADKNAYMFG